MQKSKLLEALLSVFRRQREEKGIMTDPQGSYTGNPVDAEQPVQDVDDL